MAIAASIDKIDGALSSKLQYDLKTSESESPKVESDSFGDYEDASLLSQEFHRSDAPSPALWPYDMFNEEPVVRWSDLLDDDLDSNWDEVGPSGFHADPGNVSVADDLEAQGWKLVRGEGPSQAAGEVEAPGALLKAPKNSEIATTASSDAELFSNFQAASQDVFDDSEGDIRSDPIDCLTLVAPKSVNTETHPNGSDSTSLHSPQITEGESQPTLTNEFGDDDIGSQKSKQTSKYTRTPLSVKASLVKSATERCDAITKEPSLKGVNLPGMGIFDSAPPEKQRTRNQRKDGSVLVQMKRDSLMVVAKEVVFDREGTIAYETQLGELCNDEAPSRQITSSRKRRSLTELEAIRMAQSGLMLGGFGAVLGELSGNAAGGIKRCADEAEMGGPTKRAKKGDDSGWA
ncbi:MAG: hypothetical protein M1833_006399 [Piccolia ochrophora]|nr:MAG: hypothetical protein M1833_006399 [Piccolia ochrophora]